MSSKIYSIIYDLLAILFVNVIFLNLVDLATLFSILVFNVCLILFFVIIKFYNNSSILKIFDKLKIILISSLILSIAKLLFFGFSIYYELIIFQDLLLIFILILPRILLNIREFKVNFIKNYNQSRQGTLVIGGLGYIGSGVVLDLLNKGSKVSVLDCCIYGENVLKKFSQYSNFNFIKG